MIRVGPVGNPYDDPVVARAGNVRRGDGDRYVAWNVPYHGTKPAEIGCPGHRELARPLRRHRYQYRGEGSRTGGPFSGVLILAPVVNFAVYFVVGVAIQRVWREEPLTVNESIAA